MPHSEPPDDTSRQMPAYAAPAPVVHASEEVTLPASPTGDAKLVQLALGGSRTAYEDLVRKYAGVVRGFLHARRGLRSADLDDAVQDTFVEAYRRLSSLREPDAFAGFLFTIASRVRIAQAPKAAAGLVEMAASVPPRPAWHEALGAAVGRLPEHMQAAVALKFGQGLTAAEVAARLGLAPASVTKTLSRAYALLKEDPELREAIPFKQKDAEPERLP